MVKFTDDEYEDLVQRLSANEDRLRGTTFEISDVYGDDWIDFDPRQMGLKLSAEFKGERRDDRLDMLEKIPVTGAPYHLKYHWRA